MTQVVWFKRDLRTRDHWPLAEACRKGAVLPLDLASGDFASAAHATDASKGNSSKREKRPSGAVPEEPAQRN